MNVVVTGSLHESPLAIALGATIGGGLVGLLSGELASTALAFRYTFIAVGVITLLSAGVFR